MHVQFRRKTNRLVFFISSLFNCFISSNTKKEKKAERNVSIVKRLLTTKNVRHLNTTIYLIFIYS